MNSIISIKFRNVLFLLFVCIFFTFHRANSQVSTNLSVGLGYYSDPVYVSTPGILLSPRVNLLVLDKNVTISIGTHTGLYYDTSGEKFGDGILYDFPVLIEFNAGYGARKVDYCKSNIGMFIGFGPAFNNMGKFAPFGHYNNNYEGASGLTFSGGLKFKMFNVPIGIRSSYMLNIKTNAGNIFNIAATYSFGVYDRMRRF